jgi:membrane protein involved in colicin uptake
MLAENTGQTYDKIAADTDRDYYLTAEQATEYGLIDEILGAKKAEEEAAKKAEADATKEAEADATKEAEADATKEAEADATKEAEADATKEAE